VLIVTDENTLGGVTFMPMPEIPINRRLAAGIPFVEAVPEVAYHAYFHFGGLIISVKSPCGCEVHYDASEFNFHNRRTRMLDFCQDENCQFEFAEAEKAALALLAESATVENEVYVDLGGES